MIASIPVSDFVRPLRGSAPWNALHRAERIKPTVEFIGQLHGERYFRVQSENRDRHCVVLWVDDISGEPVTKCDCPAFTVPQIPLHCLHIAQVLMTEAAEI